MAVLILVPSGCGKYNETLNMGEVKLYIECIENFPDVKVNEIGANYMGYIQADEGIGPYIYESASIKVTISDNINFTLDTAGTASTLNISSFTCFNIRFNPKFAGDFIATITVITDTQHVYKHDVHGRGI